MITLRGDMSFTGIVETRVSGVRIAGTLSGVTQATKCRSIQDIYIYIHSLATNRTRQHENNSKACTLSTASPAPLSFTLCLSFSLSLFFVFHFSAQRNNIATLSHNTSRALEEIIIALCLILGTINFFSRKWICSHFLQILMLPRYARLIVHSFVIHEYHSSTILIFQTFS